METFVGFITKENPKLCEIETFEFSRCFNLYLKHFQFYRSSLPRSASLSPFLVIRLIDLIFSFLSSHEKAMEALFMGRIQTRSGVVFVSCFRIFWLSFASNFS